MPSSFLKVNNRITGHGAELLIARAAAPKAKKPPPVFHWGRL